MSQHNFKAYQEKDSIVEQLQLLESVIKGNVLSFGKGINWNIDKKIEAHIKKVIHEKSISYKGVRMKSFDLEFSSNVFFAQPDWSWQGCKHWVWGD